MGSAHFAQTFILPALAWMTIALLVFLAWHRIQARDSLARATASVVPLVTFAFAIMFGKVQPFVEAVEDAQGWFLFILGALVGVTLAWCHRNVITDGEVRALVLLMSAVVSFYFFIMVESTLLEAAASLFGLIVAGGLYTAFGRSIPERRPTR